MGGRALSRGFTLVELLVVVMILGILVAVVIPSFKGAFDSSQQSAFVADIKIYSDAVHLFAVQTGDWPEDSSTGDIPDGFLDYIALADWDDGTPLGGQWDVEHDSYGITSAVGVVFDGGPGRDDEYMQEIDATYDDGLLESRYFREIEDDNRYYHIVAD